MKESFVTVEKGIRRKPDGTLVATKSVDGERYYKTATTIAEARKWRKYFIPFKNPEAQTKIENLAASSKLNGKDFSITFGDIWKAYQQEHITTMGIDSQYRTIRKMNKFLVSLLKVPMCLMNDETILSVIQERKSLTVNVKRCNFDNELKILNHIFNWYSEHRDPFFESPIKPFHKRVGFIKKAEKAPKHIKPDEVKAFVPALPDYWQRFATFQFYMAGRVQEPAGLQWPCVDRENRRIRVENVVIWTEGGAQIKETTKTDVVSYVYINDHMMELLDELEKLRLPGCDLVFHKKGKPWHYDFIRKTYNAALEKIGSKYRGTHILRYGMAGFSGNILGDEGSKAATRHGSMAMARKYRGKVRVFDLTDENKQVVIEAASLFKKHA